MRKILWWSAIGLVLIAGAIGIYLGPMMMKFMGMKTVVIDPDLRILVGGGGNTVILASPDRQDILLVDTKIPATANKLKQYVDALNPNARITLVNTHDHGDHLGGNTLFPQARLIVGPAANTAPAQANVTRLGPGEETTLTIGAETVKIRNLGQAHAWDNLVVYLEQHQLLATGDLVFNHWTPVVFKQAGSHIGKWIQALDFLLAGYPAKTVVPGHGEIGDAGILAEQREYFASIAAAGGDPAKLAALEKKYAGYATLPGMSKVKDIVELVNLEKEK